MSRSTATIGLENIGAAALRPFAGEAGLAKRGRMRAVKPGAT
jgi:hypothetical protein